jgi:hypothetical protein
MIRRQVYYLSPLYWMLCCFVINPYEHLSFYLYIESFVICRGRIQHGYQTLCSLRSSRQSSLILSVYIRLWVNCLLKIYTLFVLLGRHLFLKIYLVRFTYFPCILFCINRIHQAPVWTRILSSMHFLIGTTLSANTLANH